MGCCVICPKACCEVLAAHAVQVLRQLGLMADMDIDELENLAQRVEAARHQVSRLLLCSLAPGLLHFVAAHPRGHKLCGL